MKTKSTSFQIIRLCLRDDTLNRVTFTSNDLHCVLHSTSMRKKWVPYVPDYDKWLHHFRDIRDGYAKRDRERRYVVGSGRRFRKLNEAVERPVLKMVTPVAQAVEMAKSEEKRERKKDTSQSGKKYTPQKRKKVQTVPKKPKRRYVLSDESQLD